jgi:predicted metal-dependent hydrolase
VFCAKEDANLAPSSEGIVMPGKIVSGINQFSHSEKETDARILNIDEIGSVAFHRSRRARRVIISVSPSKGVRVSVPSRVSFRKALAFVDLKKGWIKKHLSIIEQNEKRRKTSEIHLQPIDRVVANKNITDRICQLASAHGFIFNRVTIRQQKTRWGSCSPKNNISLNIKLALLPETLRDYVILHELVHTRIHNHSKKFWAELDKYVPGSKNVAKNLHTNERIL